jgi:hypothetical protein
MAIADRIATSVCYMPALYLPRPCHSGECRRLYRLCECDACCSAPAPTHQYRSASAGVPHPHGCPCRTSQQLLFTPLAATFLQALHSLGLLTLTHPSDPTICTLGPSLTGLPDDTRRLTQAPALALPPPLTRSHSSCSMPALLNRAATAG